MAALNRRSSALAWLGDVPAQSCAPSTRLALPPTRTSALVPFQTATSAPNYAPATTQASPPTSSSSSVPLPNATSLALCLGPWRLQWMEGEIQEGQLQRLVSG